LTLVEQPVQLITDPRTPGPLAVVGAFVFLHFEVLAFDQALVEQPIANRGVISLI
jgi:hypothetical protein